MASEFPTIDKAQHKQILEQEILRDPKLFLNASSVERPRIIITAGQPGAGKGGLVRAAVAEFGGNAVTVDPDQLRDYHPEVSKLRQQYPYTWSTQTHGDASKWSWELMQSALKQKKNVIWDTTMPDVDTVKALREAGYDVEIRAIATHKLESELGVNERFSRDLDNFGYGRYVPQVVRDRAYQNLPGALDDVARQTGVPVQISDRDGNVHFDSRKTPGASPGQALESARQARLTPERLAQLEQEAKTQIKWNQDLPQRLPNDKVDASTAARLLEERTSANALESLDAVKTQARAGISAIKVSEGRAAIRPTIKAAGVMAVAAEAYGAKGQVEAAIAPARSTREQWVLGGQEAANQTTKTVVVGTAGTVGAVPGTLAGAATSPVTGPVGPVVGGIATSTAAAFGAEQLYENSRLQHYTKKLGGHMGNAGYEYISREGRLYNQVNGLEQNLQKATDPTQRTQLQDQLDKTRAALGKEVEHNTRYFQGRESIEHYWQPMQQRYPKVEKESVINALDKHIDAGKTPYDAVRGAYSDAVHQKHPYARPYEPLENYRALSAEQLAAKHQHYVREIQQDSQDMKALLAIKDSRDNYDQGYAKSMAETRHESRKRDKLDEVWQDWGHLGTIRGVYKERGQQAPELPPDLRPKDQPTHLKPVQEPQNKATPHSITPPVNKGLDRLTLSPDQERHLQLAQAQLGPGLRAHGYGDQDIERVSAAAVSHAQQHAHAGPAQSFHLRKDGERVAMVQEGTPVSEFSVRDAQSRSADQHLAQAHQTAHAQVQGKAQQQEATRTADAQVLEAPRRAIA